MKDPDVAVVVVSHNTREDLLRCLASIREHAGLVCEVVVVDNASSDGSAEAVAGPFPEVRVIASAENLGFSRANNRGIAETRAPLVLILNSDAELRPGALPALATALATRADVGIVGPRTVGSDATIQVSFGPALTLGGELGQRRLVRGVRERRPESLRQAEHAASREHEPDWVSASCLLARRAVLQALGGFDEAFFLYEEDVDLCVRARAAGFKVLYTPAAEVVHQLGRSMDKSPWRARIAYHTSHVRYYRKHNGALQVALLRLMLGAHAGREWAAAIARGDAARRSYAGAVLALALHGR